MMNAELVRDLLLWCAVLNYGFLLWWFACYRFGRQWMQRFHGRWFRLSDEQFDLVHYAGMATYKIGILLFNLVPYLALRIVI